MRTYNNQDIVIVFNRGIQLNDVLYIWTKLNSSSKSFLMSKLMSKLGNEVNYHYMQMIMLLMLDLHFHAA